LSGRIERISVSSAWTENVLLIPVIVVLIVVLILILIIVLLLVSIIYTAPFVLLFLLFRWGHSWFSLIHFDLRRWWRGSSALRGVLHLDSGKNFSRAIALPWTIGELEILLSHYMPSYGRWWELRRVHESLLNQK
jgi:hypothetical protein